MSLLKEKKQYNLDEINISGFGYELLREHVIHDILGNDTANILYWSGKSLARKFPLHSMDEIISFFEHAGWGNLTISKIGRSEMELELTSDLITYRFEMNNECSFQLEAGFLAQQIEFQKKLLTEAYEQQKRKANKVIFTVKWDKSDLIEND